MPAVTNASYGEKAARAAAPCLLFVAALAAGACHGGSSGPEHVDPAAFSWSAPLGAPATVYVRNTNGPVVVKPSTDGNVRVTAEARWHRGDPKRDIRFRAVTSAGNVTICALWGNGTCGESDYRSTVKLTDKFLGHSTDATIAFTVYVPAGVTVDAFTVNGSIGVASTAPVKARTMNGTIKVATAVGPVDAETVNGNVDVRMTTLGADGPVRARSVNGSVAAYLPEKFDGSVQLSSVLGGLTDDFAPQGPKEGEKDFTATVGAGGRKVDVGTVTGSAALHKLKADGTAAAPPPL